MHFVFNIFCWFFFCYYFWYFFWFCFFCFYFWFFYFFCFFSCCFLACFKASILFSAFISNVFSSNYPKSSVINSLNILTFSFHSYFSISSGYFILFIYITSSYLNHSLIIPFIISIFLFILFVLFILFSRSSDFIRFSIKFEIFIHVEKR